MAAAVPKEVLSTLAVGKHGVEELKQAVQADGSDKPYFALVRITVGQGAFARNKVLMVHVNLDSVPGIKKAKATAKKAEVKRLFGDLNGEYSAISLEDLDLEPFLTAVGKLMVGVEGAGAGSSVNIKALKADYEAMLAKAKAAAAAAAAGPASSAGAPALVSPKVDLVAGQGRKTAAELKVTTHTALEAVRDSMGAFNWALFQPTDKEPLTFMNAGSLSVGECKRFLKDDDACYGILRLSFGDGPYRRVKHVFIGYCGPKCTIAKRAKYQSCKVFMAGALGTHYALTLQLSSPDDLQLSDVIGRIKKTAVLDGEQNSEQDLYSEEAYMRALEEEAKAAGEFFGDSTASVEEVAPAAPPPLPTVVEAVKAVKGGEEGAINWALFQVHAEDSMASSRRLLT